MQAEIDHATTQLENLDLVADVDNVAMKALLNPLILQKVFCSLDTKTLKSARLVCTLWADVGAAPLGKQGRHVFRTRSDLESNKAMASLNPELLKNVKILFEGYKTCNCVYIICWCTPTLPLDFVWILPQISDKLETLEVFYVTAFEPIRELWSSYNFPHLARIRILADREYLDEAEPMLKEMAEFRPLPNLKVFSLRMFSGCRNPSSRAQMSTICQNLINSSPNLEEFELHSTFYVDLTACGKLKKFTFNYDPTGSFEFEISETTKMLESGRTSLESLILNYTMENDDSIELNFYFPNLTHLQTNAADVYVLKDSVNTTNLPKLTHFSMSTIDYPFQFEISGMLSRYHLRHVGITSLDICCKNHFPRIGNNEDGEAARRLVDLFPSVKELKFNLKIVVFRDYDQYFFDLMEIMRSFGEWELSRGEVDFHLKACQGPEINDHHERDFVSLFIIAVLRGMTGWTGLANTSLKFSTDWRRPAEFRLLDEVRDAILSCRTIRSLAISGLLMDAETKNNLETFIREQNLPIITRFNN
ncbi:Oligoribonuclease [Folsomia candida]|uniref:Oligoribonuclease n=2 Tax=Folsomia candida TaxID=158441 RepID=A0A226DTK1_FOLCA|nr:Oligoribonuclease [Folsomia candida]